MWGRKQSAKRNSDETQQRCKDFNAYKIDLSSIVYCLHGLDRSYDKRKELQLEAMKQVSKVYRITNTLLIFLS